MKLNALIKQFSSVGRWIATAVFCVSAITFIWQGAFVATAMAAPSANLIAANVGSEVQENLNEGASDTKSFIRDAANKVEETAHKNASRVDDATDDDGNFLEKRAKKDARLIDKRAEEDAARTQKAVDASKNVVEKAVENIKDAFGS